MGEAATYPVKIDRRVFVPMADGTRIALTVYLPDSAGDGPFPAVFESLPYRKDDDCTARDFSTYAYLASHGIAGVRMDIRGTGASTGVIADEYVAREQADNLEILRWTAAQDWCSGHLGMWGVSWGGFSALQTAMLRPPELEAIASVHATHDRFACDVHYVGGSLHAAEQVDWPPQMVAHNALPPDPDIVGGGWFDEWMERLDRTPQWPLQWLHHQKRDKYWLHGSPSTDYGAIECPTLLIGGWLDGYVDGMLALAEHLTCPVRTVVGPWGHFRPATGVPGPTFDHLQLLARWFGYHLRGDDNGVMAMPALTAYIRTAAPYDGDRVAGYWRAEESWPPPRRRERSLPLDRLEHDTTVWHGPQWVGSHAPAWDRAGTGSTDPRDDDDASITFETAPLAAPLEILGTPTAYLRLATDQEVGMVAARLLVVDPDGLAHLLCRGNLNLAFPAGFSDPVAPRPGHPIDVAVALRSTSAVVPEGWRLRLSLAGADFPVVWPPPRRFNLTIDPAASLLSLPTVEPTAAGKRLEIPPAPPPPTPPVTQARSESHWELEQTGTATTLVKRSGWTEHQPERDDLTYTFDQSYAVTVANDDPATTRVESDVTVGLSRPGWQVAAFGRLEIGGADAFEVTIELVAQHNGAEVFRRRWFDRIEREWS